MDHSCKENEYWSLLCQAEEQRDKAEKDRDEWKRVVEPLKKEIEYLKNSWHKMNGLEEECDMLRTENESFRVSNEKACTTVYMDLVQLLKVKEGGSVIEAVEQLRIALSEAVRLGKMVDGAKDQSWKNAILNIEMLLK